MRLESLTLHDFKSYGDAEVDLSGVRLASVVGPNGAGKSSILEAVVFALTGARGLRNLDSFIRQGTEECRVSLQFAMGSERYRITRTRSSRGGGKSTVELARQENGLWAAEGSGARETDQRTAQILAVDEDILLLTSIVAQGDAGSFFSLRPAQRLEALGAILKLDEQYQPLERYFKAQADSAKADLADTRRDIERLEADVAALDGREQDLTDARQALEDLREQLQAHEESLEAARAVAREAHDQARDAKDVEQRRRELATRQQAAYDRRESLSRELAALEDRISTKADLEAALRDLEPLKTTIAQMEEAEREDARLAERRSVAKAQADAATTAVLETSRQGKSKAAELERLQHRAQELNDRVRAIRGAEAPICDRCGQPIADEALARTLAQLETELEDVGRRRDEIQAEVETLRAKLADQKREATRLQEELAAIPAGTFDQVRYRTVKTKVEELSAIPAKLAEMAALEERTAGIAREIDEAQAALAALTDEAAEVETQLLAAKQAADAATEAERQVGRRAIVVEEARDRVTECEKEVARHQEAIALLGPRRQELTEARTRCHGLEVDQADAELLRKAFSKWGIPALIVGNVLLALEREVNELLGLYEGGLAIRFESERETGNGSRDSLEIMVFDGTVWRPFETFSGGEKYRVASAMRLGLALLLAHRSGARVETLIVDEPEGLDVDGRQHLVRILEHMSQHFGLVLLLTHYDDLKEAMPSQVVVSRNSEGVSTVQVTA